MLAAVALVAVACASLAYVVVGRDGEDDVAAPSTTSTSLPGSTGGDIGSLPDPERVALPPPPGDRGPLTAYFAGEGEVLLRFVAVTAPLADRSKPAPTKEQCDRMIDVDLAAVASSPSELVLRAEQAPDDDTRALLVNDITVKGEVLTACTKGAIPPELLAEVAYTHRIVERRLEQVR